MIEPVSPSPSEPHVAVFDRVESKVRSYCRLFPRKFVRARGARLTDDAGGSYIDFLAGCGSLNYGHNHPAIKQALLDYIADDGVALSLDMYTASKEAFLAEFERTILQPRNLDYKVMCTGPTGANAIEAALKIARRVNRPDQRRRLHQHYEVPIKYVRAKELIDEIATITFRHRLRLPTTWWLVGQTIVMLEGIGLQLDPDFDVFQAAEPHMQRLMKNLFMPNSG